MFVPTASNLLHGLSAGDRSGLIGTESSFSPCLLAILRLGRGSRGRLFRFRGVHRLGVGANHHLHAGSCCPGIVISGIHFWLCESGKRQRGCDHHRRQHGIQQISLGERHNFSSGGRCLGASVVMQSPKAVGVPIPLGSASTPLKICKSLTRKDFRESSIRRSAPHLQDVQPFLANPGASAYPNG